jgi:hypothetical protein
MCDVLTDDDHFVTPPQINISSIFRSVDALYLQESQACALRLLENRDPVVL